LVRLPGGVVEHGRLSDGRRCVRAEVTWVDHFGNIQLAATAADARGRDARRTGTRRVGVGSGRDLPDPLPVPDDRSPASRRSPSWPGELGLLIDANGHLAVVAGRGVGGARHSRWRPGRWWC
jgi:hypothetical protein